MSTAIQRAAPPTAYEVCPRCQGVGFVADGSEERTHAGTYLLVGLAVAGAAVLVLASREGRAWTGR
jgi:hypothetical protein